MKKTKTETPASEEDEIEKARFLFEAALKSDEAIQKANERVNDKIKGFMSIAATLIPIIVGLGYFILKETTAYWVFIFFFLTLVCLIAAIGLGIHLQRPLAYRVFNPYIMMKKYHKKNQRYLIKKYAITWSHTVNRNLKKINYKVYYINAMLGLILAALGLLVLTFFLLGAMLV
jgi:hypothetical protein